MKWKILVSISLTNLLFTGCSQTILSHPTKNNTEFQKDLAYCKYQALKISPTSGYGDTYGIQNAIVQSEIINSCMQIEKGWNVAKKEKSKTAMEKYKENKEKRQNNGSSDVEKIIEAK